MPRGKKTEVEGEVNVDGEKQEEGQVVEKIMVSLDMTPEDVLKYDADGKELFFESDVGRFLRLSDEQISALSKASRERYFVSEGQHRLAMSDMKNPTLLKGISITSRRASATARTFVGNKDPSKAYALVAPYEMRKYHYKGYVVSEDPNLDTYNTSPTGVHRVGSMGDDELIVMETTKENQQRLLREASEASREEIRGAEASAEEKLGQNAVRGDSPLAKRVSFGPPAGREGRNKA